MARAIRELSNTSPLCTRQAEVVWRAETTRSVTAVLLRASSSSPIFVTGRVRDQPYPGYEPGKADGSAGQRRPTGTPVRLP
jgi:hypothetical protein